MKHMIILCIASLVSLMAVAQNKITGRVVEEETKSGLEFVTVQLLTSDSLFVKGTVTDTKGNFSFDNVANGNFRVTASYVGYETVCIDIRNLEKNLPIGDIALLNSGVMLEGVTVRANPVLKKTDRQIILPTQAQVKASTNGLSLLRNLQLSRILINPVDNSVKMSGGESVQFRINGVEVTQAEVIALSPADILKIEYHDNPGLRYGNVGAVLDYIVKRKDSGGTIAADLSNALSANGYGENNLSAKYNYRKSEFSAYAYWGRRDLKWTRENYETFRFPDNTLERREIGKPTPVKYDDLNFSLTYNLQDDDKQMLNVTLRNNYNDTPNSFSDRESSLYQGEDALSISDRLSSKLRIPSLDVYYQRSMKHQQSLTFNVVGTYLNSENMRTYQESMPGETPSTVYSSIDGEKYSLITEGIYDKKFKNGKLSGGIKHTQAYLSNGYSGAVEEQVEMNTAETYVFAEYQRDINKFAYTLGIGGMRTYNSQEGKHNETYIFKPSIRLSYTPKENLFFRYNGYISGYSPSLSDLNDISQPIDLLQVRRGNPGLKPVRFYSNTFSASWMHKKVAVDFFARYSYDNKPVMESTYFEDGKFIRTMENHKGFHRINLETSVQILPWKEYIAIRVTPFLNRYISQGNTYTHTHTNFGVRGSLMAAYKNWMFMAEMNTSNHTLWGETITKEEKLHSMMLGYNKEKWSISAGVLNPFTKRYEQEIENVSHLAGSRQVAFSTNLSPIFMVNVSFRLDFGRSYNSKGKVLNNSDSDTGVLSGKK